MREHPEAQPVHSHPADVSRSDIYVENRWQPIFAAMRASNPVNKVTGTPYGDFWNVTTIKAIQHVEALPELFSSSWEYGGITILPRPTDEQPSSGATVPTTCGCTTSYPGARGRTRSTCSMLPSGRLARPLLVSVGRCGGLPIPRRSGRCCGTSSTRPGRGRWSTPSVTPDIDRWSSGCSIDTTRSSRRPGRRSARSSLRFQELPPGRRIGSQLPLQYPRQTAIAVRSRELASVRSVRPVQK